MRRSRLWQLLALLPVAALLVLALGCPPATPTGDTTSGTDKDKPKAGKSELTELGSTGWGSLKGKVTLTGGVPKEAAEQDKSIKEQIEKHKDRDHCLAADASEEEKSQQHWRVGKDGGLANVVVFLKPPDGTYFKIDAADQKPKDVAIDQPHCAFLPHVVVLFPSYYDPKDKKIYVANSDDGIVTVIDATTNRSTAAL